jgi:uncharacterized surface protein with fasciclin (FAS1) repeats
LKNLIETAIDAGNFKILINAIQEAGLFETLSTDGPYTIFAPTDEAFSKLPAGTLENLIHDKEKLTDLLTYHVLPNKVMAAQVSNLKTADTVNGKKLTIKTSSDLKIDSAKVIKTNIKCTNGIIHVIDEVLLPKNN